MSILPDEIHIDWQGPFSKAQVQKMNGAQDFGIYQFYGYHPVYGADTLWFIGQTEYKPFSYEMDSENKSENNKFLLDHYTTSDKMSVYLGRLAGEQPSSDEKWDNQIALAKKLLVYAHTPAWNQDGLNIGIYEKGNDDLFNVHIFNWGKHKQLLPEVSGRRYARNYPKKSAYKIYTMGRRGK